MRCFTTVRRSPRTGRNRKPGIAALTLSRDSAIAWRVTRAAMAESLDKVSAAIPGLRFRPVRGERRTVVKQRIPSRHHRPEVKRKRQRPFAIDHAPIPVSGSGVMLVDQMVPNGVTIWRPPALTAPPSVVWHTAQLPSAASCSPFAIVAAEYADGSGRATGAIDPHGSASALMPT